MTPWRARNRPEIGRNRGFSGGFQGGRKPRNLAKFGRNFPKFPKSGNPKKTPKIPRPPENRMSKLFVFPDFPVPNGRVIKYPQKCTLFSGFPGGVPPRKSAISRPPKTAQIWPFFGQFRPDFGGPRGSKSGQFRPDFGPFLPPSAGSPTPLAVRPIPVHGLATLRPTFIPYRNVSWCMPDFVDPVAQP